MPRNEAFPGGPLQQCLLEWEVEGALDGVTDAPGLEVDSGILVQQTTPPDRPYVIPVDGAAGLFDIDGFGGRAVRADRYIMWIRVVPATFPVPPAFQIDIVDASGLVPSVSPVVVLDVIQLGAFAAPAFYLAEMQLVPHGSVLRIAGLPAPPPGAVHRVSVEARMATTSHADAELAEASCCLGSI